MSGFDIGEFYLHPEGTFPAMATAWEPAEGQWGPRIKWTIETDQCKDDGAPAVLVHYTGCKFGKDAKINELVSAVRLVVPVTRDEAAAFDAASVLHRPFRVQVAHKPKPDGRVWGNVVACLPPASSRPAATAPAVRAVAPSLPAPAQHAEPADEGFVDPFADQGNAPVGELLPPGEPGARVCSWPRCGKTLTVGQYEVSVRAYDQPLCPPHQKEMQGARQPAQAQGR